MKPTDLLREAADYLENLTLGPSAEFDMAIYGEHKGGHEPPDHNYCGTSACAAGWLSLDSKWRARGMVSEWEQDQSGNWALRAPHFNDWEELTKATFGEDLGRIVQELVFEKMTHTRKEAIAEMREIADNFEKDENFYEEYL